METRNGRDTVFLITRETRLLRLGYTFFALNWQFINLTTMFSVEIFVRCRLKNPVGSLIVEVNLNEIVKKKEKTFLSTLL